MSTGQWRRRHTSIQQHSDHFTLWPPKMKINRTYRVLHRIGTFSLGVCGNKSSYCNPLPFLWQSGSRILFALLLVLVLLTQSDPLSCWCRVNEMTPFVGKNCKRSWSMRYPSFAVWQHLFLASRRIVGYGKWKMCKNPREIMQKVRIWSRIRMCQSVWLLCDPVQHATCVLPAEPVQHAVFLFCLRDLSCVWRERCYWLHLLLFPFESFATVIQTCTQEQLVWCCVHFALHCTCKTPCCCMEVPNHELTKTSLLQQPFLRHFKHFFHPDRTSPSKWTSVTSPKSAQNHVHESLSSDFKFSFFT